MHEGCKHLLAPRSSIAKHIEVFEIFDANAQMRLEQPDPSAVVLRCKRNHYPGLYVFECVLVNNHDAKPPNSHEPARLKQGPLCPLSSHEGVFRCVITCACISLGHRYLFEYLASASRASSHVQVRRCLLDNRWITCVRACKCMDIRGGREGGREMMPQACMEVDAQDRGR